MYSLGEKVDPCRPGQHWGNWADGPRETGRVDCGKVRPGGGVVVVSGGSGRYELVEGRRRCKAIAQLAGEDRWPAPAQLEALILDAAKPVRREVRGGLALALHATRSASPASELREIEAILKSGATDGEVATVKEIAAQTGMSIQTVCRAARRTKPADTPRCQRTGMAAQRRGQGRLARRAVLRPRAAMADHRARSPARRAWRHPRRQRARRGDAAVGTGLDFVRAGVGGGLGGPRVSAAGKPVLTLLPLSFFCLRSIQHV